MNERQYHLIRVVQKIPVFGGFELADIQQLLRLGEIRQYRGGDEIYVKGAPSDDMLVLLKGRLSVVAESGEELAEIKAGMPIGEMGLFTRQPRSADTAAVDDSTALILGRDNLVAMLESDRGLHVKILRNVVSILSERLTAANSLNESHSRMIRDLEKRLRYADGNGAEHGDEELEWDDGAEWEDEPA